MNRRWVDGLPALLAAALLALAELLRLSGVLSQYWEGIEIISNALLIGIVIFFSAWERSLPSRRAVWVLSVPLIAFPMNIDVFGHAVRLTHFPADLWGWHSFWLLCAVLLLLVLTPLGTGMLAQVKALLVQLAGILKWGKSAVVMLGNIVSNMLEQILTQVKASSGNTIFILILGLFLWVCWLAAQLSGQDVRVLLGDIGFLKKIFCSGSFIFLPPCCSGCSPL